MPKKNKTWARCVLDAWDAAYPPGSWKMIPRGTPIELDAQFRFPHPKGHFGTGRNAGRIKSNAPRWHTSGNNRGDLDNLLKLLQDALKGHVWHDDGQICRYGPHTEKLYAPEPGVLVVVTELRDPLQGT